MSVYVGSKKVMWRGWTWYHLIADTVEELHEFAQSIGLKKEYYQNHRFMPHYDVTENKRTSAIKKGAIIMTIREEGEKIREAKEVRKRKEVLK